jgi:hypothetical protein
MRIFITLLLIFSVFTASASHDPKWGPTGHRTIGEVAQKHLNHKALKKVEKILRGHGLAFVSTYGDEIKSDNRYKKFSAWHYVNYPFGIKYRNSQKSTSGDVVIGIEKCIDVLRDKHATTKDQEFYLKLLVHLVGDMHQPMHAGLAEDKGGNDFQVRWFNKGTNLHRLWDSDMIDHYKMSYTEIASNFVEKPKEWIIAKQKGSPADWIDEVHILAEMVYNSAVIGEKLGYRYSYLHFNTAREQMYLAGIRLAKILNDIYG